MRNYGVTVFLGNPRIVYQAHPKKIKYDFSSYKLLLCKCGLVGDQMYACFMGFDDMTKPYLCPYKVNFLARNVLALNCIYIYIQTSFAGRQTFKMAMTTNLDIATTQSVVMLNKG